MEIRNYSDMYEYSEIPWAGLIEESTLETLLHNFTKVEEASLNFQKTRSKFRQELFDIILGLTEGNFRPKKNSDLIVKEEGIYSHNSPATIEQVLGDRETLFGINNEIEKDKYTQKLLEIGKKYSDNSPETKSFGISRKNVNSSGNPWYIDRKNRVSFSLNINRDSEENSGFDAEYFVYEEDADTEKIESQIKFQYTSIIRGTQKVIPNRLDSKKQMKILGNNSERLENACKNIRGDYNHRILFYNNIVEDLREKFKKEYILLGISEED